VSDAALVAERTLCRKCGTDLGYAEALSCPWCGALVHSERLQQLAAEAEAAEARGDLTAALHAWGEARDLLPDLTRQREVIVGRMSELSKRLAEQPVGGPAAAPAKDGSAGKKAGIGAAILGFLAKFWGVVLTVLGKAKFLLFGLSKLSTMGSMLVYAAYAWARFGWGVGLGWVACLYVHEMGHVWELRKFGVKAGAPFFIPGFGALVMLKEHPANPKVDARIGLAGPVWGLGAAVACAMVYLATGAEIWLAIASFAAFVNLFNLIPVWQLDGGRGFNALNKQQRWIALGFLALFAFATHEPLLVLVLLGAGYRAFAHAPEEGDWRTLGLYLLLALVFAMMSPGGVAGAAHIR
jgi:Zn-dependent protease